MYGVESIVAVYVRDNAIYDPNFEKISFTNSSIPEPWAHLKYNHGCAPVANVAGTRATDSNEKYTIAYLSARLHHNDQLSSYPDESGSH